MTNHFWRQLCDGHHSCAANRNGYHRAGDCSAPEGCRARRVHRATAWSSDSTSERPSTAACCTTDGSPLRLWSWRASLSDDYEECCSVRALWTHRWTPARDTGSVSSAPAEPLSRLTVGGAAPAMPERRLLDHPGGRVGAPVQGRHHPQRVVLRAGPVDDRPTAEGKLRESHRRMHTRVQTRLSPRRTAPTAASKAIASIAPCAM